MEADPHLGLLQTWPRTVRAQSLFARLQQFATSVQGQPIAEGLSVLMGDACSYWGHNAMIRVRAFAASRSEERRVGQEWFSTCRSRWSPYLSKKKYLTKMR